jgi:glucosamine-6-phosphate deaminase
MFEGMFCKKEAICMPAMFCFEAITAKSASIGNRLLYGKKFKGVILIYGMAVKTIVAENAYIASRHASGIVSRQVGRKRHSVLLLPTGSTPLKLYANLAEMVKAGRVSFSDVTTFNLDEYLGISEKRPESYHRFMWKNFFGKIDINRRNVFIPETNPKDVKRFCREYEKKISRKGLDLAILGIGENGHVGFNEPGTKFSSKTHVASLTELTIRANSRFFRSKKQVPKKAITCGLKTIMQANKVVLLAFGKKKAKAVRAALEGKVSEKVPASILQKHGNVVFVLDKQAASLLKKTRVKAPVIEKIRLYSEFNLPKKKRIVFFSPHPDDTPISAGAIVSALTRNNEVIEVIMATGHHAIN